MGSEIQKTTTLQLKRCLFQQLQLRMQVRIETYNNISSQRYHIQLA